MRPVRPHAVPAAVTAINVLLAAGPCAGAVTTVFSYADFTGATGLTFNGGATTGPGLTPAEGTTLSVTPPVRATAGSVWRSPRVSVAGGFACDFAFRIRDVSGLGTDGLAFVIQNQGSTAIGGTGGAIGFSTNLSFPDTGTGIRESVAVVFDTFDNTGVWPSVAGSDVLTVQTRGHLPNDPSSTYSLGATAAAGDFNDGLVHRVRVLYEPGTLRVYVDGLNAPKLTVPLDLPGTIALTGGTDAYVGFTAATGALANVQRHEVLSWSYVVPTPGSAALAVIAVALPFARRARRS